MKKRKATPKTPSLSARTRMQSQMIPFFLKNKVTSIEQIRKKGPKNPQETKIAISILQYVQYEALAFAGVNKLNDLREVALALFSNRDADFERIIQYDPQDVNDYQLALASTVFVLNEISDD